MSDISVIDISSTNCISSYSQLKIKSDTVILIFGIKFFLYMTYTLRITNYLLQNTLHLLQHFVTLGNISIHRIANLIIS